MTHKRPLARFGPPRRFGSRADRLLCRRSPLLLSTLRNRSSIWLFGPPSRNRDLSPCPAFPLRRDKLATA